MDQGMVKIIRKNLGIIVFLGYPALILLLPETGVFKANFLYGILIFCLAIYPRIISVNKLAFFTFIILGLIIFIDAALSNDKFNLSLASSPIILFYTIFPFLIGIKHDIPSGRFYRNALLIICVLILFQQGFNFNIRQTSISGLGPISIGMLGCLLIFSSLVSGFRDLSIILGLAVVILSGTRSMFLLAMVFLLIKRRSFIVPAALIFLFYVIRYDIDVESNFSIVRRLSQSVDNPRELIWGSFLKEIRESYFLFPSPTRLKLSNQLGYTYPHNSIIELIALLGALALPVCILIVRRTAIKWRKVVFFFPVIFASFFSFSIYTNFYMWLYLGYIAKK